MFRNYFKIALRTLAHNKVYTFINIAGLTIGLTCAMLILLYIRDEVSFDRFHPNVSQIYRVVQENNPSTGLLQGPRFTQNVAGIKSFVRVQQNGVEIKNGTTANGVNVLFVDANFFTFFNFKLLAGNANTCLQQPNSVVLSKEEAIKQFGTAEAVGKNIMVREKETFVPYEVTAVAENCPQNSSIQYTILMPIRINEADIKNDESWFTIFLNTFVTLDDHANPNTVAEQMQRFYVRDATTAFKAMNARYGMGDDRDMGTYTLQPMADMHLSTKLTAQNGLRLSNDPIYSFVLSAIAIFILLIASINFVNLTVARSVRRAKEIGIRKAVGSDRRQLIWQFLGESFIICSIAFVLAFLLTQLILPTFNELADKKLSIGYLLDTKLVLSYIGVFLATGLLAGFYPAIVLSGYSPVETLYSRFKLKGKGILQKSLVILQFTLASFLIMATFTIYSQFNYMTQADLGYDDKDILFVSKNNMPHDVAAAFKQELLSYPDIIEVAAKNGGSWGTSAKLQNNNSIQFAWETVDESYLPALKIPLVKGRNFSTKFPGDSTHSILVNETFVKEAGWNNPLGQVLTFNFRDNKPYEVIGVVKDHHSGSVTQSIRPQVFTMENANPYGCFYIKIKPNTTTKSLAYIEKKFKTFFPFVPYNSSILRENNLLNYQSEARWKKIILYSAILTIFISGIGLFGLSVLAAEKRTKEIGIRKVLGASVQNIAAVLSFEFVKLVVIALVIAAPLAWIAGGKWLEKYPYRITQGWWLFAAAGLLVVMIALCTVSFQAMKAAFANPVKSLRSE